MNFLKFGISQQAKQVFIEKHLNILSYMNDSVKNNAPHVILDEHVFQAYIEQNGTRSSIAADSTGYQISVLNENRYERIGQFEILVGKEIWDTSNAF